jgi:hypothetical protein
MSTNTPKLGLIKPDFTDVVDITDLNDNMDVLDDALAPTNVTSPVSGDALVYDGSDWVNGPRSGNAIINGDFGVWQRGTSFTQTGALQNRYVADRWRINTFTATINCQITQQAFTPGEAPDATNESRFFLRLTNVAATAELNHQIAQGVEDVRTFAGQQITFSYWAKSSVSGSFALRVRQDFGGGGSAAVSIIENKAYGTTWQRYSQVFNLPSVLSKTIGTNSQLIFTFIADLEAGQSVDVWGIQVEAGPVATQFKLAGGGSKEAELALCQAPNVSTANVNAVTPYRFVETVYFTSSGTFTKASYPWLRAIKVIVIGAGGAGGGAAATGGTQCSTGSGGGGGGYSETTIFDIAGLASSVTVTRGAGGAGVSGGTGNAGGQSSFGALVVANGGGGGGVRGATTANAKIRGAAGGAAGSGGTLVAGGNPGGPADAEVGAFGFGGAGGGSIFGGGGRSPDVNNAGEAGSNFGGGGSGACNLASQSARTGGAGGNGIVIVELYA